MISSASPITELLDRTLLVVCSNVVEDGLYPLNLQHRIEEELNIAGRVQLFLCLRRRSN